MQLTFFRTAVRAGSTRAVLTGVVGMKAVRFFYFRLIVDAMGKLNGSCSQLISTFRELRGANNRQPLELINV